jgi:hypothetical protein
LRHAAPVAVHVINAVAEASPAEYFGIMTVPTTIRRRKTMKHDISPGLPYPT